MDQIARRAGFLRYVVWRSLLGAQMTIVIIGFAFVWIIIALVLLFGTPGLNLDKAVEITSEYTDTMMRYDLLCQSTTGSEREKWQNERAAFAAQWEDDPAWEQNSGLKRRKQNA